MENTYSGLHIKRIDTLAHKLAMKQKRHKTIKIASILLISHIHSIMFAIALCSSAAIFYATTHLPAASSIIIAFIYILMVRWAFLCLLIK